MPFAFRRVYKLMLVGNKDFPPQIVLGVRSRLAWSSALDREMAAYEFLAPGSGHGGHMIFGDIASDEGGVIDVADATHDGLVWRFEPLTIENWTAMKDSIVGFEHNARVIGDDLSLLHNLYLADFLEDCWVEEPDG